MKTNKLKQTKIKCLCINVYVYICVCVCVCVCAHARAYILRWLLSLKGDYSASQNLNEAIHILHSAKILGKDMHPTILDQQVNSRADCFLFIYSMITSKKDGKLLIQPRPGDGWALPCYFCPRHDICISNCLINSFFRFLISIYSQSFDFKAAKFQRSAGVFRFVSRCVQVPC